MAQRIITDRDLLRTFDDKTAAADAAILGACDAVGVAMANLVDRADGIEVPGTVMLDVVRGHHDHSRALGALFELAAQRFDESQAGIQLPWVFGWRGPRWTSTRWSRGTGWGALGRMGGRAPNTVGSPTGGVYNTEKNRRWLDEQLKKIRQAPLSPTATGVADHVLRTVGIPKPARHLLEEDVYDLSAEAGFIAQFGRDLSAHVRKYSDGTAEVVIFEGSAAGADVGVGGGGHVQLPGLNFDGDVGASIKLSAGSSRSGKWSFPTVAAAERFLKNQGAQSYFEHWLPFVPGMSLAPLALAHDGEGIDDAPVQTRSWGADVSGEVAGAVPVGLNLGDVSGKLSASMWYTEETNTDSGWSTDSARLHLPAAVAASMLGFDPAKGTNYSRQVGLTSNDSGRLQSLTVTSDWDGAAGQRPAGAPPAAERRRSESGSDDPHHYQHAITLDLTDPRNADLARRVAAVWDGSASTLSAKDVMQIAPLVDDEDVYARAAVSFREVDVSSSGVGVGLDGGVIGKGSFGIGASKGNLQTVANWEGTGERVRKTSGA